MRGTVSSPPERRVLPSDTVLVQLQVTTRLESETLSIPVACWNPDGWVEELEPGADDRRGRPGPAALLPGRRRHRVAGRARGGGAREGDRQAPRARRVAAGAGRVGVTRRLNRRARGASDTEFPRRGRYSAFASGPIGGQARWRGDLVPVTPAPEYEPAQNARSLRKQRSTVTVEASPIRRAETLDRVVIRFAGDSGDGMQLVGDRFTELSAVFGNDLATLPNFPAEIRAPGRHDRRGVVVPGAHLGPRDLDARRLAQRAGGDEPGRAQGQRPRHDAGLDVADQRRRVRHAQPRQGRLRVEPAARQLPRRVPGVRGADDLDHGRGHQAPRREAARRRAVQELLRARSHLVDVRPARPSRCSSGSRPASPPAPRCSRPTRPRSGPGSTSARRPSSSTTRTRSSPPSSRPARTATSPATSPSRTGSWPRRSRRSSPIFYASYPITPASDILHELSKLKNFGVKTLQCRGRDRRRGRRGRRRVRGQPRRHRDERSRCRPEVGDDRPRDQPRAPAGAHRRAARRSVHRIADQDRAGRPHARDVRPARRVAAADRRRAVAVRLLRRRVRVGAHRVEVPHAGDPAHRRLPRQRGRAVEPPRPRRAARHLGAVRDRAQPRRRLLAVPPRSRDARPSVGDPGHAAV